MIASRAGRLARYAPKRALRGFASSAYEPCSSYLEVTHPDGKVDAVSEVSKTLDRFNNATLATYSRPAVLLTRGKGLDLFAKIDEKDATSSTSTQSGGVAERQYLDFSSGIAVNSLGHADEQIANIAYEQANRLVHSSNLFHNEWSGELADRMVSLTFEHGGLGVEKGTKNDDSLKVFLANSGTEANEAALKFARKYAMNTAKTGPGEKSGLVSFHNAFHGRTMGALSMTPNPKYQAPFAPLIGNVKTGTYNSIEDINTLIDDKTAGVLVEPVQGEGGIFPASLEFLQALRRRCDEVGALLMFDEIQCGLMRTGTLWCHSALPTDAHPDLVTMAKPLANGFPIGAVLMRQKVADVITVGDHGTTFGGGPLTSRIAHHVLGRLAEPTLLKGLQQSSKLLFDRLTQIRQHFPDLIAHDESSGKHSPRGKGLLVGMSLREPSHAGRILNLARERGLIILSAGSDALRFTPSLIVNSEQVNKACDIVESCLLVLQKEVAAESKQDNQTLK
jgi:acetylornithine aminotransferase